MRKVIPAVLALITYHKQRQFLESPDKFDPMLVDLFDGEPFTVEGVLREGDHIRVSRKVGSYGHHGLYIGDEKIIHFDGEPTNVSKASIRVDSLSYFADRGTVSSVQYPPRLCFSTKRTIERAMFRLDHKGFKVDSKTYNLFSNNCEHFASWAKTGLGTSLQVEALKASLLLGAVSGLLRVGYVLFAGGSLVSPVGLIAVVGPALVNYFRSSDKISVPPPISLVLKEEQVKLMVLELLLTQKEINSQEITLLLEELSHLEHYSLGLYVDSELLGQSKLIRKELCESIGEKQADKYNVLEDLSGFVRVHYEKKRVLLEALQRKLSSSMDASGMKQDVYDYVGLLKEDVRLFENPANFYTSLKFG
jgi:hypothetical protein